MSDTFDEPAGTQKQAWALRAPYETNLVFKTLDDRGHLYGNYEVMATCAQRIKEAMGPRAHMSAVQRESLDLIATKIARLCCGDPDNADSWLDIEGYAKLARDRLPVQGKSANLATP